MADQAEETVTLNQPIFLLENAMGYIWEQHGPGATTGQSIFKGSRSTVRETILQSANTGSHVWLPDVSATGAKGCVADIPASSIGRDTAGRNSSCLEVFVFVYANPPGSIKNAYPVSDMRCG